MHDTVEADSSSRPSCPVSVSPCGSKPHGYISAHAINSARSLRCHFANKVGEYGSTSRPEALAAPTRPCESSGCALCGHCSPRRSWCAHGACPKVKRHSLFHQPLHFQHRLEHPSIALESHSGNVTLLLGHRLTPFLGFFDHQEGDDGLLSTPNLQTLSCDLPRYDYCGRRRHTVPMSSFCGMSAFIGKSGNGTNVSLADTSGTFIIEQWELMCLLLGNSALQATVPLGYLKATGGFGAPEDWECRLVRASIERCLRRMADAEIFRSLCKASGQTTNETDETDRFKHKNGASDFS